MISIQKEKNNMKYQYPTNITQAARILDKACPKWWDKITRPLNMSDSYKCILGQVFGGYDIGFRILFGKAPSGINEGRDDIFGINAPSTNWQDKIDERKYGIHVDMTAPVALKKKKNKKPTIQIENLTVLTKAELTTILKAVKATHGDGKQDKLKLKLYELIYDEGNQFNLQLS